MLQQFLVFISLGKTSKKRLALRKKEKDIKPQDCLWTEELPGPGSGPSFPRILELLVVKMLNTGNTRVGATADFHLLPVLTLPGRIWGCGGCL